MGESVAEATLTSWLKDVGDSIDMDEAVVEIATDKVDSEVPSEYKGILVEKCFKINEVIKVSISESFLILYLSIRCRMQGKVSFITSRLLSFSAK